MNEAVFIVTTGDYSEYSIRAAFSTKELAEAYLEELLRAEHGYGSIEEWPLNSDLPERAVFVWSVALNLETGEWIRDGGDGGVELRRAGFRGCRSFRANKWQKAVMGQSVVSAEHARKLAVEGRQEWLRRDSPDEYWDVQEVGENDQPLEPSA